MIRKTFHMIQKIKLSQWICFCLVVILSTLGYRYYLLNRDFSEFKSVHGKSVEMVQKMETMEKSLEDIDQTLTQINKFSSKLKVIARIKKRVEGKQMAQKKPKKLPPQSSNEFDLNKLENRIKNIRSDAKTEELYLANLDEFFSENETLLASVPANKPAGGRVTSRFGFRKNPIGRWQMHDGIDIAANYGAKIASTADGLVVFAGYTPGYGRHVVIDHGFGIKTVYAHASELLVKAGQYIKRGAKVAKVGASGNTRGIHLHYEVRLDNVPLDPADFMFN